MATNQKRLPPLEYLRECFDFDAENGLVLWRVRPRHHFPSNRGHRIFNAKHAGKPAGSIDKSTGHVQVLLSYHGHRQKYQLRRIAWSLCHNQRLPKDMEVIHTEGDKLSLVARYLKAKPIGACNQNHKSHQGSSSSYVGVCKAGKRWKAQIHADGENHHLGYFDTEEAAHAAYLEAKLRLHPHQQLM